MDKVSAVNRAIELIARLSIDRSSQVLSKMLKVGANITMEKAFLADISEVTQTVIQEHEEVVGTFIDLSGDLPSKFLLFVAANDCLALTDMLLRKPVGTTQIFDEYVISTIQEIGNVLASAICNVFSADFQINMRPSPPEPVHDYAGSIFQQYIMTVASQQNEIMIIQSKFCVVKHNIRCSMFIVPQEGLDKIVEKIAQAM